MSKTDTATDRQIDFVKTLFTEAQTLVTTATEPEVRAEWDRNSGKVEAVRPTLVKVLGDQPTTRGEVSDAISTLKSVVWALKNVAQRAGGPVALRQHQRVIPNRFAKACVVCHTRVEAGEGYAAQGRNGWETWCKDCASETEEDRQRKAAAEQAEARAQRLADQAKADELRRNRQDVNALVLDTLRRSGFDRPLVTDPARVLRLALPSATGNNDLDFYVVTWSRGAANIRRTLGGHGDIAIQAAEQVAVAERLCCTDDLRSAVVTYGRELGVCGRCGKELTDEDSRAAGIGPVCAGRF